MNTGAAVLSALREKLGDRYEAVDVLIDRKGRWHTHGREIAPDRCHSHFDIAWNALHGSYGEDGGIQSLFEAHGIPFTGSRSLGSAIGMNRSLTKKVLRDHGLKSPYWKEASAEDIGKDMDAAVEDLFNGFIFPAMVKPAQSGLSAGISVIRSKSDIAQALIEAAKYGDQIIVEEYIPGTEVSCVAIDGFRGEACYALPPIEIRAKSEEIIPAKISESAKRDVEKLARAVHQLLNLRHYSRTDFVVHPRRGVYVLETRTLPGLSEDSLMPQALKAVGSSLHDFIDHIIRLELGV